jgi:hypothetical protein
MIEKAVKGPVEGVDGPGLEQADMTISLMPRCSSEKMRVFRLVRAAKNSFQGWKLRCPQAAGALNRKARIVVLWP